ncbi:hypothetical protein GX48_07227 [Paracoccidioides brasiliensis]|nr:hypothetical protein GX48_07227 [Paracoccidioides brasiliensis]
MDGLGFYWLTPMGFSDGWTITGHDSNDLLLGNASIYVGRIMGIKRSLVDASYHNIRVGIAVFSSSEFHTKQTRDRVVRYFVSSYSAYLADAHIPAYASRMATPARRARANVTL